MLTQLINSDISVNTPKREVGRIRLINISTLLSSFVFFLFSIILAIKAYYTILCVYLLFTFLFWIPIVLNKKHHYPWARALFYTIGCLALVGMEILIRSTTRETYIICLMMISVFLADTRKEAFTTFGFIGLAYIIIKAITFFNYPPPLIIESGLAYCLNILFGSISLFVIVYSFKTDIREHEQHLDNINTELEAKTAITVKQSEQLSQKNAELLSVNNDMKDSIRYARRIQNSMLLSKEQLMLHLPDVMIFYKPKDLLSGDFYWFTNVDNQLFLAVADCTGHGVPGAMMTVIGNNLLHQIVGRDGLRSPAAILYELDKRIVELLQQRTNTNDIVTDGMDLALVRIDKTANNVTFSSAKRPLFFFHGTGSNLTVYPAGKWSLGGYGSETKVFTDTDITFTPNDIFYLSSDGYTDQFGPNKKYLSRRFRQLLTDIHRKPMPEQHRLLNETHLRWRVTEQQTDDIMVIGIRL